MTKLTAKEQQMLKAFIDEGRNHGAETAQELIEDNMTWQDADFLAEELGWNKQEIGGVMSALEAKGLICDYGEPIAEKRAPNAWTATDKGIQIGWGL